MTWRIISVNNRAKLDFKLNYLVVRTSNSVSKVHIGEINTIIIESTAVSLTSYLLNELVKRKIAIIFCDEKRMPCSSVVGLNGSFDTSYKLFQQTQWSSSVRKQVWSELIRQKISNQLSILKQLEIYDKVRLIEQYLAEVTIGDLTNREGLAAKVYFKSLFGENFTREDDFFENVALNYGYSILLSYVARTIVSNGYVTQLGVFHSSKTNPYNLASDLMEPFRPVVDIVVKKYDFSYFGPTEKALLKNILNLTFVFNGQQLYLQNIIVMHVRSTLDALTSNDVSRMRKFNI